MPKSRKQVKTGLSDKMEQFCQEYIIDFNGAQAAIRAGYSAKTAKEQAAQNLTKLNIQCRIRELAEIKKKNTERTADEVLRAAWKMFELDLANYMTVNEGGELQAIPFDQLPKGATKLISKIKEKSRITENADGSRTYKDSQLEYEIPDKVKLLEILFKHYGLLSPDNKNNFNFNFSTMTDEQLQNIIQGKMPKD